MTRHILARVCSGYTECSGDPIIVQGMSVAQVPGAILHTASHNANAMSVLLTLNPHALIYFSFLLKTPSGWLSTEESESSSQCDSLLCLFTREGDTNLLKGASK